MLSNHTSFSALFPELPPKTTKKGLKMGDMIPTLVKAIQEQQAMIEELKSKVTALENK